MEQQTSLICLLLLLTSVEFSFEQQNCIPLNKCSSLMLLLRNRDDLPNLNRVDVYRHLQLVKCNGFQGNDPLVDCPEIEGIIPIWKKIRFGFLGSGAPKALPRTQRRCHALKAAASSMPCWALQATAAHSKSLPHDPRRCCC
jgi:hypothetical protein